MITVESEARLKARELINDVFGKTIPIPVPLIYICDLLGISVWQMPMDAVDSFAFRDIGGNFAIVMNSRVFPQRRSFSLAHEVGHFSCGHLFTIDRPTPSQKYCLERAADVFAAELIMPRSVSTYRKWTPEALAKECNVTITAARIRIDEWTRIVA